MEDKFLEVLLDVAASSGSLGIGLLAFGTWLRTRFSDLEVKLGHISEELRNHKADVAKRLDRVDEDLRGYETRLREQSRRLDRVELRVAPELIAFGSKADAPIKRGGDGDQR